MATNTLEIIRHIPSGCLYAAVLSDTGHIVAISDEISQDEAIAVTPDTMPEWGPEEDLEWAQHESFGDVRTVATGWGI